MSLLDKIIKKKETKKEEIKIDSDKVLVTEKKKVENVANKEKKLTTEVINNKLEIGKNTKNAYKILLKPLITEKAANLSVFNKYVFLVANSANKSEVKKAVENVYKVKPVSVSIIKLRGKKIRTRGIWGKRNNKKKAIITLNKKDKLDIYEGV